MVLWEAEGRTEDSALGGFALRIPVYTVGGEVEAILPFAADELDLKAAKLPPNVRLSPLP